MSMTDINKLVKTLRNLLLIIWPPLFVLFLHETCSNPTYKGSLEYSFGDLPNSLLLSLKHLDPRTIEWHFKVIVVYHFWIVLQFVLYFLLPSNVIEGTPTPAGTIFKYRCNGYWSFLKSNLMVILLMLCGYIDGLMFHNNFYLLLWLSNFYGVLMATFVYLKAHFFPTSSRDCVFDECAFYNYYMGIEHSPRVFDVDLKLFFNARTGIAAWPLINLSLAMYYRFENSYTDYSIVGVNIIQYIYVIDLFYHEEWYIHTMDIAHDHFGFYLAWGDIVWLPFMYTFQSRYLTFHHYYLTAEKFYMIMSIAIVSYLLFRWSNSQRKCFRESVVAGNEYYIWGKPATYIKATYTCGDGQIKESYLLTSGFWGICRHFNYLVDLVFSLCACLFCGFNHIIPYFYFFYMVILLLHRIHRDQVKCKEKYGRFWEEYCKTVPYKLVPYIY